MAWTDLANAASAGVETDPSVAAEAEALKRGGGTSDADLRAYAGAAGGAAGAAACAALGAPAAAPLCSWAGSKLGSMLYDFGKDVVGAVANLFGGTDPCTDNPSACTATNELRIPWVGYQAQLAEQWIAWWLQLRQLGVEDPPKAIAALASPGKGERDWWSAGGLAGALVQWPSAWATSDPANHYRQYVALYAEASRQLTSAALLAAAAMLVDQQRDVPKPIGFRVHVNTSANLDKPVIDFSGTQAAALYAPSGAGKSSLPAVSWFRCALGHMPIVEADARQSTAILQTGLETLLARPLAITGSNDPATIAAWAEALKRGMLDPKNPDDVAALGVLVVSGSALVQQAQIAGGFMWPQTSSYTRGVPQGDWSNLVDGAPSVVAPQPAASAGGGGGAVATVAGAGVALGLLAWALPKLIGA